MDPIDSTTVHGQQIRAKTSSTARILVAVFGFTVGLFSVITALAAAQAGAGVLLTLIFLVIFGFFYLIFKWATRSVELTLTSDGLGVRALPSGASQEIHFSDISQFAVVSDRRGNYWIRLVLKSTGKTVRYNASGIRKAARERFLAFAYAVQAAVDAFNAKETAPQTSLLESRVAEAPIKTGLNKSEKRANKWIAVYRVVWMLVILISVGSYIASSSHPGDSAVELGIGVLVIIGLPIGVMWYVKKVGKLAEARKLKKESNGA